MAYKCKLATAPHVYWYDLQKRETLRGALEGAPITCLTGKTRRLRRQSWLAAAS